MASEAETLELAASLSAEDVPIKLRCATCSLIALNALRLPCCEQNICENCYNELEDVCQVCHHEPLDKSLCTPNKSLRTTTKVFLKKKLLERSKELKKRDQENLAAQEVRPQHTSTTDDSIAGNVPVHVTETVPHEEGSKANTALPSKAQVPDGENTQATEPRGNELNHSTSQAIQEENGFDHQDAAPAEITGTDAGPVPEVDAPNDERQDITDQTPALNQGSEGDGMVNFPMGMNPMMGMDMPNMMAMGMDPMMMNVMASSMFGGFGGPNMGMNMGMGQSPFGGPWMADQDSYMSNAHGSGHFGNQAGYNMPSYQRSFNQMNRQPFAHNNVHGGYSRPGFYPRGGRGRRGGFYGGYGRFQHGQMNQANYGVGNNFVNNQSSYQQPAAAQQEAAKSESVINDGQSNQDANHDYDGDESTIAPALGTNAAHSEKPLADTDEQMEDHDAACQGHRSPDGQLSGNSGAPDTENGEHAHQPLPIQTFISDEPRSRNTMPVVGSAPAGSSPQFSNSRVSQGNLGPTHVTTAATQPRVLGVPGAPTGPRALREGMANTGWSGLALSKRANPPITTVSPVTREDKNLHQERRSSKSDSRSKSRSRSRPRRKPSLRSRSPENAEHHSTARQRTPSHTDSRRPDHREASPDEFDQQHSRPQIGQDDGNFVDRESQREERRRPSHEREDLGQRRDRSFDRQSDDHRHNSDYEYTHARDPDRRRERNYDAERADEKDVRRHRGRTRSISAVRSPRYKDSTMKAPSRKRRNREDDERDEYRHNRSRDRRERRRRKRSRRDRSKSRDRDNGQAPPSREHSKTNTPITPNFPAAPHKENSSTRPSGDPSAHGVPTGPRAGSDRRRGGDGHRSRRRRGNGGEERPSREGEKASEKDPHTLEREARDRERMMKEKQRRAAFEGGRGKDGAPGRRGGVKYEDENHEDARRIERERESHRWR